MTTDHYGPVRVEIDEEKKTATMRLRRGKMPLSDGFVQSCREWARLVTLADWPDYQLIDETGIEQVESLDGRDAP